jgi:hypothetical protein
MLNGLTVVEVGRPRPFERQSDYQTETALLAGNSEAL